jgi:predicted polyphosphate/ATP-dependent NAD kinase
VTRRLGFIVNPVAGLGGTVALKGTDGAEIVRRARELGAQPVAPIRAGRTLARLDCIRDDVAIVAGASAMGGDLARRHAFVTDVVGTGKTDTTAADTRAAAAEMERMRVDLILYAGGDGTTRDILDAVGTRVPILGIPTGVKMQSATFATSPEAAGDVALAYLGAASPRLREAEVMDLDEDALRAGVLAADLYGAAVVPDDPIRLQHPKAGTAPGDAQLDALCLSVATETGGLTLFGPGTTTQRILRQLGVEGTLLGVDAVEDGRLVGRDLRAAQLIELVDKTPARLVIGVVGGQGYLFGRGNQQLSPAVIRRIGLERIEIVASAQKLFALDPLVLRVDTGDPDLDAALSGFRRVRVGSNRFLVIDVTT